MVPQLETQDFRMLVQDNHGLVSQRNSSRIAEQDQAVSVTSSLEYGGSHHASSFRRVEVSWSQNDSPGLPAEFLTLSANLYQADRSVTRGGSESSDKEPIPWLVDPDDVQGQPTTCNVIQDLLESWNNQTKEVVEKRLMKELRLVTELELELSTITSECVLAFGRILQRVQPTNLVRLKLFSACRCTRGTNSLGQGSAMIEIFKAVGMNSLSSLRHLELLNTGIDPLAAKDVAAAFSCRYSLYLQTLKVLDNVGDSGFLELAEVMEAGHLPNLKTLCLGLSGSSLVSRTQNCRRLHLFHGAEAMGKVFKSGKLPSLEHVQLFGLAEEEAVKVMIEALASIDGSTKGLKSLTLCDCQIGDGATAALATALQSSKFASLRKLDLSSSKSMADANLTKLFKAFKSNILLNMQELALDDLEMGEESVLEIATLLEAGYLPNLVRVSLETQDSAEMSNSSAEAFVSAFRNNQFLYTEVKAPWGQNEGMRRDAEGLRWRNVQQRKRNLRFLRSDPDLPARHARVFICGPALVGKTTLRKSLCRSQWAAFRTKEGKSSEEPSKGIDVCRVQREDLTLTLWDLAGQSEYQLLQSALLPDLASGEGQATIFVIVCSDNYSGKKDVARAKRDLNHWLKFIVSSPDSRDTPVLKRQVFVAMNSFDEDGSAHCSAYWTCLLNEQSKVFEKSINLHPQPFILKAMYRRDVRPLKNKLFETAGNLLRARKMPKLCLELQTWISQWLEEHDKYPVLEWRDYFSNLAGGAFYQHKLRLATEYLHEAGELIYLRDGALLEAGLPHQSYVILDTNWFCRSMIGTVLHSSNAEETPLLELMVRPHGYLPVTAFQTYLSQKPSRVSWETQVVIAMLLRLGLVYKIGLNDFLIPAFLEIDCIPEYFNSQVSGEWVMGYSLELADTEGTLMPMNVFRLVQVELAWDPNLGGRSDSLYAMGQNIVTFKHKGMAVMVEYRGHTHRVDVLVKPLLRVESRRVQVNLAHDVLSRIHEVGRRCCPGVEFVRKMVEPWKVEEGLKPMEFRNVRTSVSEVKFWIQAHGSDQPTSMVVNNDIIMGSMLLSDRDLLDVQSSIEMEELV